MRIAVLQRDPVMRQSIEQVLLNASHTCVGYDDGLAMSKALARSSVDLLVLDWQATRLSGAEVLRSTRGLGGDRLPVMFASSDTSEKSMVRALAAGADDYVALPLRPAEFRERIEALLRRAYPELLGASSFDVGPYHFDTRRQLVMLRGQPVPLSGTQYRLAALFFSNIGRVMSRDHIFAMVWGREFREFTRTIDSHVSRLRLLLEIEAHNEFRLQPIYKSGYRLLHLRQGADVEVSADPNADKQAA
ncbi:Response regulator with CheY-like receiver domain and winged-helix DNA-binding domain [Paraburkholderia ribeironis]|uniref:Response regulator with CheY-like receiver domain and winged-helix DNA-binding domain n=1 Tax=Paraburkholderia ribeironis TaxID=1247936 RepID=A0A1N7SPL7_9BURK|nr:response regulator transcription factor [Paraburkholderia ribeironis]SIT49391.1 Response regulator with CheY-like receiver domain and winged-helix DNA-binding domain [Paraburkholderia ribeironis]